VGRRRRKTPNWLPRRVYPHGWQYRYVAPSGKAIVLGPTSDPAACLARYAKIIGPTYQNIPPTIGDGLDRYIRDELPKKKPRTQQTYCEYIAKLRKGLGHMAPREVTKDDLYQYHGAREAPVRANREVSFLGQVYRHLIRWRAAETNPFDGFLYAEETARRNQVSLTELRAYNRKAAPRWMRVYCLLKLLTGLRQCDLLLLGDMNVDNVRGVLRTKVAKGRGNRAKVMEFRLTWALRAVLRAAKALPRPRTQTLFFVSQKGRTRGHGLSQSGFNSAWDRAQKKWITDGSNPF
jgi:site-specific recombinase XerD